MVFLSIASVFIIILTGFLCRLYNFPGDDFWRGAEKITYFLFFPSLLIVKLSQADVSSIPFSQILGLIFLLLVITSLLIILSKPLLSVTHAGFTSVFQGGVRFNTYIGLALIDAVYGSQGLVIAVVIIAVMVPLVNILCVTVLTIYGERSETTSTTKQLLSAIITNPLILACLIGIGLNMAPINLPVVIAQVLLLFSQVALPLGLLAVGAALNVRTLKKVLPLVFASSVFKFMVLPIVAMLLCHYLGVDSLSRDVLLVLTILPTATASYVLAKQMGGDAELMAAIITLQTLIAAFWIPFITLVASLYLF